jgi:hypothetical protein
MACLAADYPNAYRIMTQAHVYDQVHLAGRKGGGSYKNSEMGR